MLNRVSLKFPSHPKYLSLVREMVGKAAEMVGFEEKDVCQVKLAVSEACANVIRHSYKNDFDQEIELDVILEEKTLSLAIRDRGESADERILTPCENTHLKPGGLGVHLIHQCMNEVSYERLPGGANQLFLVKNLD